MLTVEWQERLMTEWQEVLTAGYGETFDRLHRCCFPKKILKNSKKVNVPQGPTDMKRSLNNITATSESLLQHNVDLGLHLLWHHVKLIISMSR